MPVISSSYKVDFYSQADGSYFVFETHTDSAGKKHVLKYLARPGTNYQTVMENRVSHINKQIVEQEFNDVMKREDDLIILSEQSTAEFAERFWKTLESAKRNNQKFRYHFMVWRIWQWVQAGTLTNEQVRQSFNSYFGTNYSSGVEWNTFVQTKIIPIKDRYLAWRNEQGLI